MIVAQIVFIGAAIGLMVLFLLSGGSRTSAMKKIAAFLLVAIAIVFIIRPAFADDVAQMVGIGRGSDLVLYGLVFVVVLQIINNSVAKKKQQKREAKIVRQVSLLRKELEELREDKENTN